MSTIKDFDGIKPTWCPGCGNHGIGIAIKTALVEMGLTPSSLITVFGIGCSGNMNDFLNAYAIHSLHGRSIPNAIGAKLANHKIPVIVIGGDGDLYGEGGNHFIHGCRGNHDIKVFIHDNKVYGLTTGQVSPSAPKGFKSKSTPNGIIEIPINPLALAIISGATFAAQIFAGDLKQMITIIKQAMRHKGMAIINILQPCVTFNKLNTYDYYLKRTYKLPADYQANNQDIALKTALENNSEKFPLGIIYQSTRSTFTDELVQIKEKALVEKSRFINFDQLMTDFV